jgi:hypothetical protein
MNVQFTKWQALVPSKETVIGKSDFISVTMGRITNEAACFKLPDDVTAIAGSNLPIEQIRERSVHFFEDAAPNIVYVNKKLFYIYV